MEDAWFATEQDYGVFDGVSGAAKVSYGEVYRLSLALTPIIIHCCPLSILFPSVHVHSILVDETMHTEP